MFSKKSLINSAVVILAALLSITSIIINNEKHAANRTSTQIVFTEKAEQKNKIEETYKQVTSTNKEETTFPSFSKSTDMNENKVEINHNIIVSDVEKVEPIASSTINNKKFAATNTANTDKKIIVYVNSNNEKSVIASSKNLSRGGSKPTSASEPTGSSKLTISGSFPVSGRISSKFGRRWGRLHKGLDIAAPTGTNVYAFMDGKVAFSGRKGGYGNLVILDHGNGLQTYYAHNSKLLVKEGEKVTKGTHISEVGSTGHSTGPHCHFEIRKDGTPLNPAKYIK